MFGGNFPGNGHHGHGHGHHGHHGHHNNHHNDHNHNQGFNQQGFNQHVGWAPIQGAQYKLVSALNHNMVLDVSQSHHDMNNLIIYQWNNGANQIFYFQGVGGNRYGIFSSKTHQTV